MKSAFLGPFALTLGLVVACGDDSSFSTEPEASGPDAAATDAAAPGVEAGPDEMTPGQPDDGGPLPDRLVIAEGQEAPTGIAVDATSVYFANRDAGTIVKCPLRGCGSSAPTEIVSGQDHPISISMDATHLYWVTGWREGDKGGVASRPIFRCELPDCPADGIEEFERGSYQAQSISVIGDVVYLAAWPSLAACSKDGCSPAATTVLGSGPFISVDASDTWIFGAKYGQSQVERCPITGCLSGPAFVGNIQPLSVVVDDDNLYIADYDFLEWRPEPSGGIREPRILSCPIDGCPDAGPIEIETGDITPYALAESGDRLYFTNVVQGTVVSIRK